jgi:hypothetical protein
MTDDELPLQPPPDDLAQASAAELERRALIQMRAELLAFLDSPTGQLLRDRAQAEKDSALADLVQVSPTDTERIRALQGRVLRVDGFTDWLQDLLFAGEQAADTPEAGPAGDD